MSRAIAENKNKLALKSTGLWWYVRLVRDDLAGSLHRANEKGRGVRSTAASAHNKANLEIDNNTKDGQHEKRSHRAGGIYL